MEQPAPRFDWHTFFREAKLILIEVASLIGLAILLYKGLLHEWHW